MLLITGFFITAKNINTGISKTAVNFDENANPTAIPVNMMFFIDGVLRYFLNKNKDSTIKNATPKSVPAMPECARIFGEKQ